MKIHSPYPASINKALAENLGSVEFVKKELAEISLPNLPLPVRIGEILQYIEAHNSKLRIVGLSLDISRKILGNDKVTIDLTEKEVELLHYLIAKQTPATTEELSRNVWGYSEGTNSNTVESHIYRLRQKILSTFGQEIIITEAGNYKIVEK